MCVVRWLLVHVMVDPDMPCGKNIELQLCDFHAFLPSLVWATKSVYDISLVMCVVMWLLVHVIYWIRHVICYPS